MAEIEVINFADTPSIVNRYMLELRDIDRKSTRLNSSHMA